MEWRFFYGQIVVIESPLRVGVPFVVPIIQFAQSSEIKNDSDCSNADSQVILWLGKSQGEQK